MAHSFVEIGKIGFWAHDRFIESMQLCLINEIEIVEKGKYSKWLSQYKIELALESLPLINGGMSMSFDKFLTNQSRFNLIIEIIERVIDRIKNEDKFMTGNTMHQFRLKSLRLLNESGKVNFKDDNELLELLNNSNWTKTDISAEIKNRYLHSFILLKKLVCGEMKTTVSSPVVYWNY